MVIKVLRFEEKGNHLEFKRDFDKLCISAGDGGVGRQNNYKFELDVSQLDDLLEFLLRLQSEMF